MEAEEISEDYQPIVIRATNQITGQLRIRIIYLDSSTMIVPSVIL